MKNKILVVALGMLCLVFNYSCQEEESLSQETQNENALLEESLTQRQPPQYTAKTYSGKDVQQLIFSDEGLKERLQSFNLPNANSRTLESSVYGFNIDTIQVQHIQTASYDSYTFMVERDEPTIGVLENYMYTAFTDGSYKQYLVTYPIFLNTAGEVNYDINNATITSIDDTSLLTRNGDATTCITTVSYNDEQICQSISCDGSENHTMDEINICPLKDTPRGPQEVCQDVGWIEENDCSGGGGSGPDYEPPTDDPGFEGGSIHDEPGEEDEIVIPFSSFTKALDIEECLGAFNPNFVPGTVANAGLSNTVLTEIYQYLLIDNSCSSEAKETTLKYLEGLRKIKINNSVPDCLEDIILDLFLGDVSLDGEMGNIELIEDVFSSLGTNNPGSDLNFEFTYNVANISGNGSTSPISYDSTSQTYSCTITIDSDLVANGTKLALVKTVLHESIHAYLRYVAKQFPSIFNDPNGEFSTLISAWKTYNNNNDAQHTYMASIITNMANSLSNFVEENYNYPNTTNIDYYESVCWSGITHLSNGTINPLFSSNYPSIIDQDNIIKIFNTENGTGSFPGYTPLINNNCN